jgi:hypothetical protein
MPTNYLRRSVLPPFIAVVAAALAGCATPGINAVQRGDAGRLQQVLDQPNHANENLETLLVNSVYFDCVECARLLMKMGVKPTPNILSGAALQGREKIASLMMDYGAESSAAMTVIHSETRQWVGGCCLTPEQAQNANDFFQKLERQRASRPAASVPASPAPAQTAPAKASPAAAPEELHARSAPLFREAEHPDDFALIVGIEKYDALPPATYAERDAAAAADFAAAMGVPARNIVTLTGAHATRAGLAKQLEGWLPNNVNANSTVYFFYSGHGAPDPKNGHAYLVPYDGDPEYLEQTSYPLKRAYQKMGELKAKRVIVMIDSCFSGAGGRSVLAKGARPLVSSVDTGFNSADGKIAVLAAADGDQISGTNDEKGHGLFTYYLFNGLNGAAKDASGQVTLKSLFDYVKPQVMGDARRANREQVPQYESGGSATDRVVLRTK